MSRTSLWPSFTVDQKDRLCEFFGAPEHLFENAMSNEGNFTRLATMGDAFLSLVMIQTLHPSEDITQSKGLYTCNQSLGRFMTQLLEQGARWNKHRLGDMFEVCLYITSHPQVASSIDTFDLEVSEEAHLRSLRCVYALKKWVWTGGAPSGIIHNPHEAELSFLRNAAAPVQRIYSVKNKMIRTGQQLEREMRIQEYIKAKSAVSLEQYSNVLDMQRAQDRNASLAVLSDRSQSVSVAMNSQLLLSNLSNNNNSNNGKNNASNKLAADLSSTKEVAGYGVNDGYSGAKVKLDRDLASRIHNNLKLPASVDLTTLEIPRELMEPAKDYFAPLKLKWCKPLSSQHAPPPGDNDPSSTKHMRTPISVVWATRSGRRAITPEFYPCCGQLAADAYPCVCSSSPNGRQHNGYIALMRENREASNNKEEPAIWSCCGAKLVTCVSGGEHYRVTGEHENGCIIPLGFDEASHKSKHSSSSSSHRHHHHQHHRHHHHQDKDEKFSTSTAAADIFQPENAISTKERRKMKYIGVRDIVAVQGGGEDETLEYAHDKIEAARKAAKEKRNTNDPDALRVDDLESEYDAEVRTVSTFDDSNNNKYLSSTRANNNNDNDNSAIDGVLEDLYFWDDSSSGERQRNNNKLRNIVNANNSNNSVHDGMNSLFEELKALALSSSLSRVNDAGDNILTRVAAPVVKDLDSEVETQKQEQQNVKSGEDEEEESESSNNNKNSNNSTLGIPVVINLEAIKRRMENAVLEASFHAMQQAVRDELTAIRDKYRSLNAKNKIKRKAEELVKKEQLRKEKEEEKKEKRKKEKEEREKKKNEEKKEEGENDGVTCFGWAKDEKDDEKDDDENSENDQDEDEDDDDDELEEENETENDIFSRPVLSEEDEEKMTKILKRHLYGKSMNEILHEQRLAKATEFPLVSIQQQQQQQNQRQRHHHQQLTINPQSVVAASELANTEFGVNNREGYLNFNNNNNASTLSHLPQRVQLDSAFVNVLCRVKVVLDPSTGKPKITWRSGCAPPPPPPPTSNSSASFASSSFNRNSASSETKEEEHKQEEKEQEVEEQKLLLPSGTRRKRNQEEASSFDNSNQKDHEAATASKNEDEKESFNEEEFDREWKERILKSIASQKRAFERLKEQEEEEVEEEQEENDEDETEENEFGQVQRSFASNSRRFTNCNNNNNSNSNSSSNENGDENDDEEEYIDQYEEREEINEVFEEAREGEDDEKEYQEEENHDEEESERKRDGKKQEDGASS